MRDEISVEFALTIASGVGKRSISSRKPDPTLHLGGRTYMLTASGTGGFTVVHLNIGHCRCGDFCCVMLHQPKSKEPEEPIVWSSLPTYLLSGQTCALRALYFRFLYSFVLVVSNIPNILGAYTAVEVVTVRESFLHPDLTTK